jgi:hypothetical protein
MRRLRSARTWLVSPRAAARGPRQRMLPLGPLVLAAILVTFLVGLLVQYAHLAYGIGKRFPESTLNHLWYRPGDGEWVWARPELNAFQPGISTWPHVFGDLFDVWLHGFEGNPYTEYIFGPSLYPPLLQLLTKPWHLVSYPVILGLFLFVCAVGWLWLGTRSLRRMRCPSPFVAAFIVLFFTLPLLFAMDRGNVEALVAMTLPLALLPVVGMSTTRSGRPWLLVLGGFLKISPIALLGIVRWNRRTLIETGVAIFVFGGASAVALLLMNGDPVDTARAYAQIVTGYSAGNDHIFEFRTTIWGTLAAWMVVLRADPTAIYTISASAGLIGFVIMLANGVVAAVLPLHLWERVVLVATGLVLWSGDGPAYRGLYLVVGLLLLIGKRWNARALFPTAIGLLLVCALAPKPTLPSLSWLGTLATGTPMIIVALSIIAVGLLRLNRIWTVRRQAGR